MSFLGEIKRRKIFQVAAVYAVVAWLLIQIVATIEEPLNLPAWFDTAIIVLLAIGFPITLIISWAFNLTPEGLVRETGGVGTTPLQSRKIEYVLIGLVVVALGWLVYRVEFDAGGVTDGQRDGRLPNSVAMLPCDNLSQDPEDAFFAVGIHESTLNQLAKIRDINLIARSTVMQYADNRPPIPEIAEALNVEMVMECSVRYANNQVLMTVQLIDGITGTHIDSEEYPGDLTDIFGIQGEIAAKIAATLQAELLPEEQQRIQKAQTSSPEAYSLYLQAANIHLNPGGAGPTDNLHQFLDQAIKLDPGFARAHALKAYDYAYAMIRNRLPDDPEVRELEQLAFEHAGRALSLDPEENLAYVSLANIHRHNWRATEAEGAFERALELAPNDPINLNTYSSFLSFLGKHDKAIELGLRADELDASESAKGRAYLAAGNFDAAYSAWNDAQRNDPADEYGYYHQAITEWHRGNEEAALANMKIAEKKISDDQPAALARIVYSYGLIDRPEDALRLFRSLEQMAGNYHIRASSWVYAYLGIRDYEEALTWLRRIDEERNPEDSLHTFQIASNRYHDPALEQPEFVGIRKSLALRQ